MKKITNLFFIVFIVMFSSLVFSVGIFPDIFVGDGHQCDASYISRTELLNGLCANNSYLSVSPLDTHYCKCVIANVCISCDDFGITDANGNIIGHEYRACSKADARCCISKNLFRDADNDTFGGGTFCGYACSLPGCVDNNLDCRDDLSGVNPLATELCNGIDDDCDGIVDNGPGMRCIYGSINCDASCHYALPASCYGSGDGNLMATLHPQAAILNGQTDVFSFNQDLNVGRIGVRWDDETKDCEANIKLGLDGDNRVFSTGYIDVCTSICGRENTLFNTSFTNVLADRISFDIRTSPLGSTCTRVRVTDINLFYPCGYSDEICDGVDNDGDDFIDETFDCIKNDRICINYNFDTNTCIEWQTICNSSCHWLGLPNNSPTVQANGPYTGLNGTDINLFGTCTDSDGNITQCVWTVANMTNCTFVGVQTNTGLGTKDVNARATVRCSATTTTTVTLNAVDNQSGWGSQSVSLITYPSQAGNPVKVINTPPSKPYILEGSQRKISGGSISIMISQSVDPDSGFNDGQTLLYSGDVFLNTSTPVYLPADGLRTVTKNGLDRSVDNCVKVKVSDGIDSVEGDKNCLPIINSVTIENATPSGELAGTRWIRNHFGDSSDPFEQVSCSFWAHDVDSSSLNYTATLFAKTPGNNAVKVLDKNGLMNSGNNKIEFFDVNYFPSTTHGFVIGTRFFCEIKLNDGFFEDDLNSFSDSTWVPKGILGADRNTSVGWVELVNTNPYPPDVSLVRQGAYGYLTLVGYSMNARDPDFFIGGQILNYNARIYVDGENKGPFLPTEPVTGGAIFISLTEERDYCCDGNAYDGLEYSFNSTCSSAFMCGTSLGQSPIDGNIVRGNNYFSSGATLMDWNFNPVPSNLVPCEWSCKIGYVRDGNTCILSGAGSACLDYAPQGLGVLNSGVLAQTTIPPTPRNWGYVVNSGLMSDNSFLDSCEWSCMPGFIKPVDRNACVSGCTGSAPIGGLLQGVIRGPTNPTIITNWVFSFDKNQLNLGYCEWGCATGFERVGNTLTCKQRETPHVFSAADLGFEAEFIGFKFNDDGTSDLNFSVSANPKIQEFSKSVSVGNKLFFAADNKVSVDGIKIMRSDSTVVSSWLKGTIDDVKTTPLTLEGVMYANEYGTYDVRILYSGRFNGLDVNGEKQITIILREEIPDANIPDSNTFVALLVFVLVASIVFVKKRK